MKYEVSEKGGATLVIGLEELSEGQYRVQVDGSTFDVDAVKSGPTIYSVIEDGLQFEVMVDEVGAHGFDVMAAGTLLHLTAIDERTKLLAATAHAAAVGRQQVEAEMPGKVVKISVSVGSQVREGQGVLVLEAMKMENEIPSPIDGVISELGVSEGQAVDGGQLLFVVEPADESGGD